MRIPDTLPIVEADPGLLERAVANLVDNARRHSPAGSPVVLDATVIGDLVHLHVEDHGSGVAPESWGAMLAPFERLDDRTAGPGLGLAIVKGFCEAMGVTVTPRTTRGGGLTMTLEIPVSPETPAHP